jgi:Polyketide cyclase / dehydrase and lipid transport
MHTMYVNVVRDMVRWARGADRLGCAGTHTLGLKGEERSMVDYKSSVRIQRPPEAVFPYLVEPAKQALWSDVPMKPITGGDMRIGTRMEISFGLGPLKARVGLEITALEQDVHMAFASFSGPIGWTGEYRLEPDGSTGTTLSQEGALTFKGIWRLLQPIVGAEISRGEVKELEKLKAVVEGR